MEHRLMLHLSCETMRQGGLSQCLLRPALFPLAGDLVNG
ncbi:hypothetical protein JL2886_03158 [Phaeobacter gallaeciensis]|uniref:Uncharacterized protein n=1 Tax=Phaeobacter gallaeciensis TaxID=60890 RepID=A0A1B0ZVD1_9RHOB|nr:hypothetical protein JL2886_03158 [Phaeobacter gallaeciensis]